MTLSAQRSPQTALVLDDDELVQAMISDMLQEANCSPLKARSAEEAEALLDMSPCMAFLDVNLPGKQGDRFCQQLRASDQWWDLPVVMITSAESGKTLHRCFAAGADDFAYKPLLKKQILSKLEAVRKGLSSTQIRKVVGKSLLVATEKSYFGNVFNKLLENAGYTVHRARTIPETLALLATNSELNLAVIDLDLGAHELEGALLDRAAAGVPLLPVVAVTSNKTQATRPNWAEDTLFDVDTELERLVHYVNASLLGTASGRERRVKQRVPFKSIVNFRLYGDGSEEWQAGYGYDLSDTGIFVRTLTPLDARQPVELTFKLDESAEPLQARGIVSWTNLPGPRNVFSYPCGMGIAYSYIDAGDWTLLHDWIAAQS